MRTLLIASLAAVLALGVVVAQAEPLQIARAEKGGGETIGSPGEREFAPGPRWHKGKRFGPYERLGLTKEQKKDMRALTAAFMNDTRSARTTKMALKDEKKAMIIGGKIDFTRLAAIDDELVKVKGQIMTERLKMKRARLELLTDEQRDVLADFMAKKIMKKKHHGTHHGMHRGR
ncbi:MAG: Spy/CpxP family protein refolding chaperone [Desulfomonilaceae bacterium]|nr:Spy/CpxP family protein refolding chaperone [Desulfomonilaceae bacterium]